MEDEPIASVVQDMRKGSKWLSAFLESYRPPLDGERYLTDGEVSELLRVSRRTLQEYRNNRVFRIVDKFLTKQETALLNGLLQTEDTTLKTIASLTESHDAQTALLLCWCAKETIYKYFSEEKLMFDEMQICLEEFGQEGTFYCTNIRQDIKKTITYMQNEEFVLTYTL